MVSSTSSTWNFRKRRITKMSEIKNMPKVETESVSKGAQRARYTAYMQGLRKLEQRVKSEKNSREKAARVGGAV
jgi:hypothetical protein